MAMTPQKPPSKPNPLHGAPPKEEEVAMPGKPPAPDMFMPPPQADASHLSDNTLAEHEAGKTALSTQDARTKAEQEAGKAIIDRLAQRE
jgi:hypothetical protein